MGDRQGGSPGRVLEETGAEGDEGETDRQTPDTQTEGEGRGDQGQGTDGEGEKKQAAGTSEALRWRGDQPLSSGLVLCRASGPGVAYTRSVNGGDS